MSSKHVNNACSLASYTLLNDNSLACDVEVRNALQKAVGPKTTMTLAGVNFSTLLRQRKEARKEAKSTASNTNKITPVQVKNNKWYRNKLSGSQLGEENIVDLSSNFSNGKKPICVDSADKKKTAVSHHPNTPVMEKRVRKRIAKTIVKEGKSLTTKELGLLCKVQKNLTTKDVHTTTALADADDLPSSQDALNYLKAATSPPVKK